MKKIIATTIFGFFVVVLLLPAIASAQPQKLNECCAIKAKVTIGGLTKTGDGICVIGPANGLCVIDDTTIDITGTERTIDMPETCNPVGSTDIVSLAYKDWGLMCIVNSVYNVTNWIFYLLMIIVVVMVVIGGATYMLAAGNPERAKKGRSIIIYGIIGLVIALLARLIPSLVKVIVGMG